MHIIQRYCKATSAGRMANFQLFPPGQIRVSQ